MKTITMRTLSRETARVLDELRDRGNETTITRDGIAVARLVPVSPVERALYERLAQMGIDPDNPPPPDPDLTMLPPTPPGQKSAFDYLMEERDSYYREP